MKKKLTKARKCCCIEDVQVCVIEDVDCDGKQTKVIMLTTFPDDNTVVVHPVRRVHILPAYMLKIDAHKLIHSVANSEVR